MTMKIEIGTLTLAAPYASVESFECAAWTRTVEVAPGTYPVSAYVTHRDGAWCVVSASVRAPGVVTHAYFASMFGGVPIKSGRPADRGEVGTASETSWRVTGSTPGLAVTHPGARVATGSGYYPAGLALAEGWRPVCVSHGHAGETRPGHLIPAAVGALTRAEEIALAAEVVARAKAASYWERSGACSSDARTLFAVIVSSDVRARAAAALARASVSLYGIAPDVTAEYEAHRPRYEARS